VEVREGGNKISPSGPYWRGPRRVSIVVHARHGQRSRVSPGEPAVVAWPDDLLQCLGDL